MKKNVAQQIATIKGEGDPDITRARELVAFLEQAIKGFEFEAAHPTASWRFVDPATSPGPRPMRLFVRRLHSLLAKEAPATRPSCGCFPVVSAQAIRDGHYRELPPSQQRRWRVALMRFLDVCVALEGVKRADAFAPTPWEALVAEDRQLIELPPVAPVRALPAKKSKPPRRATAERKVERKRQPIPAEPFVPTIEEALPIEWRLPFALASLGTVEQRTRLLAAWRETKAGAKTSSSRLNSKWIMLRELLSKGWGCTKSSGALASEYDRHAATLDAPAGLTHAS